MNRFLPDHNDPIVSILLLLGIIFIVATLSYAYSIWRNEQKKRELIEFLKSFELKDSLSKMDKLEFDNSMREPLLLLAKAYQRSGEYSKGVDILLFLIKKTEDDSYLKYLADLYFKAGFLERAKRVYLEILSKSPKDIEVLYRLELLFEKLNQFEDAKEVLLVLKELGEDTREIELYLEIKEVLSEREKGERFKKLEEIFLKIDRKYKAILLRELFRVEPKRAFSYYQDDFFKELVDILYLIRFEQLDLNIISKHSNLRELYYIKGYISEVEKCESEIFAINLLTSAKRSGFDRGDLRFIYICSRCKSKYPIFSLKCPSCSSAFTIKIEILTGERYEKRGNFIL